MFRPDVVTETGDWALETSYLIRLPTILAGYSDMGTDHRLAKLLESSRYPDNAREAQNTLLTVMQGHAKCQANKNRFRHEVEEVWDQRDNEHKRFGLWNWPL